MNIGITVRDLSKISGTPIHVEMLCRYLKQVGHTVHLITMADIHKDMDFSGCHIHQAKDEKDLSSYEKMQRFSEKLIDVSNRLSLDIIHAHYTHGILAGVLNKIFHNIPFVFTLHGGETLMMQTPWKYHLFKMGLQEAETVISVSKAYLSITEEVFGIRINRPRVIHDAIYTKKFQQVNIDRNQVRASIQINPEATLGVFIGRLDAIKGPQLIIEAAAKVLPHRSELYFLFVGTGDMKLLLLERVRKQKMEKHFRFIGYQPHESIPNYLAAADFVILPSLWEAFGISMIETLSVGKPLIASNVGAIPEVIKHGQNGFLFQSNNSQHLAEAILNFLDADANYVETISANALKTAYEFDWSQIGPKIEKTYQETINLHSGHTNLIRTSLNKIQDKYYVSPNAIHLSND